MPAHAMRLRSLRLLVIPGIMGFWGSWISLRVQIGGGVILRGCKDHEYAHFRQNFALNVLHTISGVNIPILENVWAFESLLLYHYDFGIYWPVFGLYLIAGPFLPYVCEAREQEVTRTYQHQTTLE